MSKLIDVDKLKDDIKCLKFILKEDEWDEDDEMAILETIDSQPEVMITCMKCHGSGTYRVPIIDDNGEWTDEWETCKCEVCHGTGKIALEFYESLQKGCRR